MQPPRPRKLRLPLPLSILLVLALALGMAPAGAMAALAAAPDPLQKVEKKVLDQLASKGEASFYVLMRDKATLAGASAIRAHGQRASFVRQRLTATADTSQAGLRAFLDARRAAYQPFWIVNTVKVTGDRALLKEIASRDDVGQVLATRNFQLVQPKAGKPRAGVQSVEWNIDRIRAPEVWSTFGDRGEGIVVANIDSGVEFDHPALVRQYRGNLGNGQFDHNYNWFDPAGICADPAPCDNVDHGTHVMGTMVGDDGDPGPNQVGVAPHARWIAAKGCEFNTCTDASLLGSGQWVLAPTDLNGQNPRPDLAPNIVNNSWGGIPGDPFYQGIVDAWVAAGIFPTFAAGNAGPACGSAISPGDYLNSYAVGNHDIDNVIDVDSSRGPSEFGGEGKPNITAPGDDVRSSVPGGGYEEFSGTSMATPHVSATVALMWSAAPSLVGDIATTRQLLDDTAIDVPDNQCGGTDDDNNVWGEGRLDAFAAVQAAPRGATGTLAGSVTDAASGQPIAGAAVHITGPNDRSTTSGTDGSWSLALSVGAYDVTVSKFGFLTRTANAVEVADGGTTSLNLALTAAVTQTVSGHVRDDRGDPVANADVTILGTPLAPATTDAAGAYSIADVPVGEYDVSADAGRCLSAERQHLVVDGDETLDFTLDSRSDGFGYVCRSSAFDFVQAGTVLSLTGDDAATAVDLPFPFTLYGTTYRRAFVATNGTLNFATANTTFSNTAVPDTDEPNAAIYPFWDDLIVDATASVRTEVIGTAPNRQLVVEWRNVRVVGDTIRLTFEAVLGENGRIQFQYADLASGTRGQGDSATVGIENATGTDALQYSFADAALRAGTAITFRRPNAAFAQGTVTDANDGQPVAGATVRALLGDSVAATATSDADGFYRLHLALGPYTVEVAATGYQTATSPVRLDQEEAFATADFSLATGRAEVAPDTIQLVVPAGQQRFRQLTIRNSGGAALTWRLEERSGGAPLDVPWLTASPTSGTLATGGSQPVGVLVDTTGLAPGIHDAALVVLSNSGRGAEVPVAVRLVVPAYQTAVDAGGGSHVDALGDAWQPDRAYSTGSFGFLDSGKSRVVSTNHAIDGTDDDTLYQTTRQDAFEYRFDGLPAGTYQVDLRFAEPKKQNPNKRLFDVIVEGQLVLPALDIALEVGSFHADDHVTTLRVTDGQLNVRLVTRKGFGQPIIGALRVTERPDLA